eukprot:jgi/Botrbrau1/15967/Bobra.0294s0005.1
MKAGCHVSRRKGLKVLAVMACCRQFVAAWA